MICGVDCGVGGCSGASDQKSISDGPQAHVGPCKFNVFAHGALDAAPTSMLLDGTPSTAEWPGSKKGLIHCGKDGGCCGGLGEATEGRLCGVG